MGMSGNSETQGRSLSLEIAFAQPPHECHHHSATQEFQLAVRVGTVGALSAELQSNICCLFSLSLRFWESSRVVN
jgi:hypothetical protein